MCTRHAAAAQAAKIGVRIIYRHACTPHTSNTIICHLSYFVTVNIAIAIMAIGVIAIAIMAIGVIAIMTIGVIAIMTIAIIAIMTISVIAIGITICGGSPGSLVLLQVLLREVVHQAVI